MVDDLGVTSLPLTRTDTAATASLEPDDQPLQTSYLATKAKIGKVKDHTRKSQIEFTNLSAHFTLKNR